LIDDTVFLTEARGGDSEIVMTRLGSRRSIPTVMDGVSADLIGRIRKLSHGTSQKYEILKIRDMSKVGGRVLPRLPNETSIERKKKTSTTVYEGLGPGQSSLFLTFVPSI